MLLKQKPKSFATADFEKTLESLLSKQIVNELLCNAKFAPVRPQSHVTLRNPNNHGHHYRAKKFVFEKRLKGRGKFRYTCSPLPPPIPTSYLSA